MGLLDKLKGLTASGTATLIEKTGNALDGILTNKEELLKAKAELAKVHNDHAEKMQELSLKAVELELQEMNSARNMQIEALRQDDPFSKRFIYYLSGFLILCAVAFNFSFFWVDYPVENKDFLNRAEGIINTIGFASVISFFFGSTKGSKDKTDAMVTMSKKESI